MGVHQTTHPPLPSAWGKDSFMFVALSQHGFNLYERRPNGLFSVRLLV